MSLPPCVLATQQRPLPVAEQRAQQLDSPALGLLYYLGFHYDVDSELVSALPLSYLSNTNYSS